MRVHWTHRARTRLKQIHDYIAEDAPMVALKVVDRVTARSQTLTGVPNLGRKVPEFDRNDVRELLENPYRIIYKIKSDQIDVLTVMHYRQVLPQDINIL